MQITIPDEYEEAVERRARALGYKSIEEFVVHLLAREVQPERQHQTLESGGAGNSPGEQMVAHMRGKATGGLTTDEVMAMTRSDD